MVSLFQFKYLSRPSRTKSKTCFLIILLVLNEINAVGCDMFMDIHGDEALPYAFISGSEGVPKWQNGPRLGDLQTMFVQSLMQAIELAIVNYTRMCSSRCCGSVD
jgi:hypothetical protein